MWHHTKETKSNTVKRIITLRRIENTEAGLWPMKARTERKANLLEKQVNCGCSFDRVRARDALSQHPWAVQSKPKGLLIVPRAGTVQSAAWGGRWRPGLTHWRHGRHGDSVHRRTVPLKATHDIVFLRHPFPPSPGPSRTCSFTLSLSVPLLARSSLFTALTYPTQRTSVRFSSCVRLIAALIPTYPSRNP